MHKETASHGTLHELPQTFPVFSAGKVNKAISPKEVSEAVKRWAKRLGRDPTKYSAKSLRRGSTSIAAAMRVSTKIRKQHGGWKSKRMPDRYLEQSTAQEKAVSRAVHKAFRKSEKNKSKRLRFKL